ncbi:MAG TPA: cob(I)yrinic acid a,c-diamide adenosyltransferase [Thermoanaerobaculia bacterium]|nr:cob(I)yrinic acid a,c-diamide adenosyltransferase [Thermoanaerobaculia bacterium]
MKIYTRTGDAGETSLFGGRRVSKSDPRIDAYGTIDELNSFLGLARATWPQSPLDEELGRIQSDLFDAGAQLAAPGNDRFKGVDSSRATALERAIDEAERELAPLTNFILPGGSAAAAQLHVARTICRRAERILVSLGEDAPAATVVYLNRLSDFLFVAARLANKRLGFEDVVWGTKRG